MTQPSPAVATVGTMQDAAPLPAVQVQRLAVDWAVLLPVIFAGIALLITTTFSAWASVKAKTGIRTMHRRIEQNAATGAAAGALRDVKLDHITVLVNGRYTQVLQELADVRRQFAGLSGRKEDQYQATLAQQKADAHAQLSATAAPEKTP